MDNKTNRSIPYWKDLIVEEELTITGRGLVFVVSLLKNRIVKQEWVENIPIEKGDLFTYNKGMYEIRGIEIFKNLLSPPRINERVGLLVKQIIP